MERIIRWFVNNSVASNLMMFFIILSGVATIPLLKMEVFPEIDLNIINVSAVYPGATPSDVEEAICIKIEERLQGLDGVKKITSNAEKCISFRNSFNIFKKVLTKLRNCFNIFKKKGIKTEYTGLTFGLQT